MRKLIATLVLIGGISISCTSKNTTEETPVSSLANTTQEQTTTENKSTPQQEELTLVGSSPEKYAISEEKMINRLNEPDQMRLSKAIQIVSNKIAETIDLYTEEDDIDFDKWHAAYCKQVDGLTFNGITQLAEQILKELKTKNITHLQEEITDLRRNPSENQEESMSFLLEEMEKAKQLPITIDTYQYSEECFL